MRTTWRPPVKPPVGAAYIDWSHPLARGLVGCWLFNEGAGSPANLVKRRSAVTSGTPTWTQGRRGVAKSYGATDHYETLDTTSALPLPLTRATVLAIRRKTDTTLRASSLFGEATTASRLGAHVPYSDGTVYWDFHDAGTSRLTWGGYSVSTDFETWAFVYGATQAIYFNGALQASQAGAGATRSNDGGDFFANRGNGLGGDLQEIVYFSVSDAEITAAEIAEWNADPYAFLRPVVRRVYARAAAVVGAGTTIYDRYYRGARG